MPYVIKQLGTFDPSRRKEGEKVIPTIFVWEHEPPKNKKVKICK